jgi:flagellar hook-basal body complex protein FliE
MTAPIQNVSTAPIFPQAPPAPASVAAPAADGPSFRDFLVQSIHEVNSMQADANQAVEQLMTGGSVTPAEVLTAVQKADIAFQMMIQVRNKLVDAFQQVQDLKI